MPTASDIHQIFERVAPRYDFLNHSLSGGFDFLWRRFLVKQVTKKKPKNVLDLAAGSGDVTLALKNNGAYDGVCVCADFCVPMLEVAHQKNCPDLAAADAVSLPFKNESFEAVTIAFGYRNVQNRSKALHEILRVLRPNGTLYILEFSHPTPFWKNLYWLYLKHLLPCVAALFGAKRDDYTYLHDSIRSFPKQEPLVQELEDHGFKNVIYHNLTGGIAALHSGIKK